MSNIPCLSLHPAVCAVENEYEIILVCTSNALASVTVGNVTYTDNNNGVMRTDTLIHKIRVPAHALNAARHYRVNLAPLADHCNYYPKPEPTQHAEYDFHPVPEQADEVRMYVLADSHGDAVTPAKAALAHADTQVLILDGDIGDSADTTDMILTLHRLASEITKGEFPVVYARGNHDTRGHNAEHLTDYAPTARNGSTYYSFRLGPVWGVVLDAGEDKPDGSIEYGGVCDFLAWRREQTEYLRGLIRNRAAEYEAPGVHHRIAVCHMPFHYSKYGFAQTTPDIYADWVHLLNEMGIETLLCGHCHCIDELPPSVFAGKEKPIFETLLCSAMSNHPERGQDTWIGGEYTGTAVYCCQKGILHCFTNRDGETVQI